MENTQKRERTRARLKEALITLFDKKNFYEITIWDICNEADTYRSTFYRYYDTKDEMLREIEREYLAATQSLTSALRDFSAHASPEQRRVYLEELTADMEYHMANERVCRFLLSPAGDLAFHQKMIDSIAYTARNNLRKNGHIRSAGEDYLINFFASGFVATIHNWLERKDRSPAQTAEFLLSMMERLSM